ncbi:MAG: arsenate reductase ArsC [Nitrospirae bacterium]|nr:arsenate reductase ArsC [Nitrospirota bacterium]MCL5978433.1 arsenate reductase ArsC [Nitrospirota bacterium]
MNIELLYIKDCPNFKPARRLIHDIIRSFGKPISLGMKLRKIEIKDSNDAEKYLFPFSPTVRINGEDIEPETAKTTGLACRIYRNGTGLPDRDVLKCKIAKAAGLKTILFVCTANAVRSQMAEAIVNHFLHNEWIAFSAGIMPMEVRKGVAEVMKEIGIDISMNRAKHIDLFKDCAFDRVITLCSDADRLCINYPVHDERDRIIFHDPVSTYGFRFGHVSALRKLRDEIKEILLKHIGDC